MTTPHTEHRVGDGPWTICLLCEKQPAILSGLHRWPVVGDRFEIDGELWRVVAWTDRIVCEREPS